MSGEGRIARRFAALADEGRAGLITFVMAGDPDAARCLELVRGLGGLNLVGMDVVEVSPPYDHAEITAIAAATVAHDWLCLLARDAGAAPREVGRL